MAQSRITQTARAAALKSKRGDVASLVEEETIGNSKMGAHGIDV